MDISKIGKEVTVYGVKQNYYYATKEGQVFSRHRNKPLTNNSLDKNGYSRPSFRLEGGKSKRIHIHRIILATYNPIDGWENLEVNHKDGNKLNNSLDNLEWCTTKENIQHAWKTGLVKGGENHPRAKMDEETAIYCLSEHKKGRRVTDIARELGVGRSAVNSLVHGRTWKYLSQKEGSTTIPEGSTPKRGEKDSSL